jgi:rhodanese-related sulfurtransferase
VDVYREMEAGDLAAWQTSGKTHVLLDVREPHELQRASFSGALAIPMNEIPARTDEIPRDKPIVVACHYGARSATVAQFLVSRGFSDVYNLEGGIDAYAVTVDPTIPRY